MPPPEACPETIVMSAKNFLIAILLATAIAAGLFLAVRLSEPPELTTALVLPEPTPLPDFALIDQHGNAVTRDRFRGHWNLVFFGFTHCPDICPTTMQTLSIARSDLAAAGQDPLPRIVLVSVDPERDSPEVIGQYVDYFGDDNLGVTGDLEEIRKLTSALGIYFEKQPGDVDSYNVDHSTVVLVVNPEGGFHGLFSGPHLSRNFVHDVPIIIDAYKGAPQQGLAASDVVVTPPLPGSRMSAGYLTLRNGGSQPVRITRVDSAQFGSVEIHESVVEDGVARMRPLPELKIEPRASVTLERGGKHLMLMRPDGAVESVTLDFYTDDSLLLSVTTDVSDPAE